MKLGKEGSFKIKIRQMSGSLKKPFSGDESNQEKRQGHLVLQRFHLLAKGCSESQGSVKPGTVNPPHCGTYRGLNAEQALQNQHFVKKV